LIETEENHLNFLGIGPGELLMILVLALIVFGPKRLPEIGRTLGKTMKEIRSVSDELTSQFRGELEAASEELESISDETAVELKTATEELRKASGDASKELKDASKELQTASKQATNELQTASEKVQTASSEVSEELHAGSQEPSMGTEHPKG
jgi:Tat protein translocase TatB subunit